MKLLFWLSEKLVRRLVVPFLFFGVVAVLFFSLFAYHSVYSFLEESIDEQLHRSVDLHEKELNRWIDDQKSTAIFISRAPVVRERVVELLRRQHEHPNYIAAYRELSEFLFSYIKNFVGLREVMIISNDGGHVLFSTNPASEGAYRTHDTFFVEGKKQLFIQGVYPWRITGEPTITISRPLLGDDGKPQGVLAVHLDVGRMTQVVAEHPGLGNSGRIYLVDRFGNFVTPDDFGLPGVKAFSGLPESGISGIVSDAIRSYNNYAGQAVVGYLHWLPELEVAIVAEIGQAEAFAPARDFGLIIAVLGLVLTVALAISHILYARRIANPLEEMVSMANRVVNGDFSVEVPVYGKDETAVLAGVFNRMVQHLRVVYGELEDTAEYFRTIFNFSPSAIAVQRFDNGAFVHVNESFCQMFDLSEKLVLGRSEEDLHIYAYEFSRLRVAAELNRSGLVREYEASFCRGDGSRFEGVLSSRVVELSGDKLVLSILVDLSEIRSKERDLSETSARLQLLLERMPVGCITWNRDFTANFWNPAAEQIFGYSAFEAIGRHAYELIVPVGQKDDVTSVWKRLLAGEDSAHSQTSNVTSDGRSIVCDWYHTPLKDEAGETVGVLSMVHDVTEKKAAEDTVREQSELLQTILNAIPAPIYFKDAEGIYRGCNQAFCDFLGLPYEKVVGHTVYDVAPEEKARIYEAADRELLRQGGVQIYEAKVQFADGSDRDVVFHKAVFRTGAGEVAGMVGNMLDVTEIRKAKAELAESEINYREIFNASTEALIVRDLKTGKVLDVNQAMLDMYGYSYDEALQTTIDDLTSNEPPYTVERAYEKIARTKEGAFQLFEWRAKRKDGTFFWVEISLQQAAIQGEARILAVVRDISERKEAEQAQKESDERFHLLLEHAADALFLHDAQGVVLTVNQRSCDWLGYRREELIGMNVAEIDKGVDPARLRSFWDSLETGTSALIEGTHRRKDGSTFPVDVNVVKFAFHGADFFLALARDVSERKATEAELESYRHRLEELVTERTRQLEEAQEELVQKERMAVLGQLTATVSHELRNPLGTIKNSVFLLEQILGKEDERLARALGMAERNVSRCDGIINELLDYTRQQELQLVEVDAGRWLDSILVEQQVPPEITLEVDALSGVQLRCDLERARRAFINVFFNAVQAIQAAERPEGRIEVQLVTTNDRVGVVVRDNGVGVADDVKERIFEPMFSTKNFGVGLGMPIVKNILAEHGGEVEFESVPDEGAVVTLWFPR